MIAPLSTPAYGYVRVSSLTQLDGFGFARQAEVIETYATAANYNLLGITMEQYTGTETDRPAYLALLEMCVREGVQTIIVESSDRFARFLNVQTQLIDQAIRKGLSVHSAALRTDLVEALTGHPDRKFQVQLFGLLAEWERDKICHRLAEGRKRKKAATGRCEGRRPFGTVAEEKPCLTRIENLIEQGAKGYEILRTLNREGFVTRTGIAWTKGSLSRILARTRKRLQSESRK